MQDFTFFRSKGQISIGFLSKCSILSYVVLYTGLFLLASGGSMIKWSSTMRLDDYFTVKALRRQIALADNFFEPQRKPNHKRNEELATALTKEVGELCQTLRTFGLFSDSGCDMKKRVEVMKRIREDLGEVFLCSLRVANSLDIDVSQSINEKIYPILKESETPWKKD